MIAHLVRCSVENMTQLVPVEERVEAACVLHPCAFNICKHVSERPD